MARVKQNMGIVNGQNLFLAENWEILFFHISLVLEGTTNWKDMCWFGKGWKIGLNENFSKFKGIHKLKLNFGK